MNETKGVVFVLKKCKFLEDIEAFSEYEKEYTKYLESLEFLGLSVDATDEEIEQVYNEKIKGSM